MKILKKIFMILGFGFLSLMLIIGIQYIWKGSPESILSDTPKEIVAHRGVHCNYQKGVYDPVSGCKAKHIFPPAHNYIENTLTSIKAAFEFGATIVEIDIRKTADSNLIVFHDYALECRTNGQGLIADQLTV